MIKKIEVFASGNKVGTLALTNDQRVAFQYDAKWLETGFSISPLKLPLDNRLFMSSSSVYGGLFGVFADSLPDSFGEFLMDRYLKSKGIDPNSLTCLDRLAYVGSNGMGLLEYHPDLSLNTNDGVLDFDTLQKDFDDLLSSNPVEHLEDLCALGASSGGARPKSLIRYKGEDYIVKFCSRYDPRNIGEVEYRCMSLASKCGIDIPTIDLVTTKQGNKYYLTKRFDRIGKKKVHMISAAGLLEYDFRIPTLDYETLMKLTAVLTREEAQVRQMFRRMVFNVLMDNQDDHDKNFAFLYDEEQRKYRLSPAYDLTPSRTFHGERMTSVNGKGKFISDSDMLAVARTSHIPVAEAASIIKEIRSIVEAAPPLA